MEGAPTLGGGVPSLGDEAEDSDDETQRDEDMSGGESSTEGDSQTSGEGGLSGDDDGVRLGPAVMGRDSVLRGVHHDQLLYHVTGLMRRGWPSDPAEYDALMAALGKVAFICDKDVPAEPRDAAALFWMWLERVFSGGEDREVNEDAAQYAAKMLVGAGDGRVPGPCFHVNGLFSGTGGELGSNHLPARGAQAKLFTDRNLPADEVRTQLLGCLTALATGMPEGALDIQVKSLYKCCYGVTLEGAHTAHAFWLLVYACFDQEFNPEGAEGGPSWWMTLMPRYIAGDAWEAMRELRSEEAGLLQVAGFKGFTQFDARQAMCLAVDLISAHTGQQVEYRPLQFPCRRENANDGGFDSAEVLCIKGRAVMLAVGQVEVYDESSELLASLRFVDIPLRQTARSQLLQSPWSGPESPEQAAWLDRRVGLRVRHVNRDVGDSALALLLAQGKLVQMLTQALALLGEGLELCQLPGGHGQIHQEVTERGTFHSFSLKATPQATDFLAHIMDEGDWYNSQVSYSPGVMLRVDGYPRTLALYLGARTQRCQQRLQGAGGQRAPGGQQQGQSAAGRGATYAQAAGGGSYPPPPSAPANPPGATPAQVQDSLLGLQRVLMQSLADKAVEEQKQLQALLEGQQTMQAYLEQQSGKATESENRLSQQIQQVPAAVGPVVKGAVADAALELANGMKSLGESMTTLQRDSQTWRLAHDQRQQQQQQQQQQQFAQWPLQQQQHQPMQPQATALPPHWQNPAWLAHPQGRGVRDTT